MNEDHQEEDDFVSRTQIKNEAQEMRALGLEIAALPQSHFNELTMGDALRAAIEDYRRITHKNALKRQASYVGKMVRNDDAAALRAALNDLTANKHRKAQQLKQTEQWSVRLVNNEENALNDFFKIAPHSDRQQLRALIRNVQKDKNKAEADGGVFDKKHSAAVKRLFKFLQEQI